MPLWILELYDHWFECPVTIGIYSSFENAEAAYDIVMRQLKEKNLDEDPEDRFDMAIEPVHTDAFIDAALAWIA